MDKLSVIHNRSKTEHFLYFGQNNPENTISFSFFTPIQPKDKLNKKLSKLYLINTINDNKDIANLAIEKKDVLDTDTILNEILVFKEFVSPLNLIEISVISSQNGLLFKRGNIKDKYISFWAYEDPLHTHLYPLSFVVWPPAVHMADSIKSSLSEKYIIVKDKEIQLKHPNQISKLVYKLYEDDKRCNKNKLIHKIKAFESYPLNFRYIKLLVKNPLLNDQNVSKVSIRIKNKIRNKFRSKIKHYFNDIILHSSDNQKHSRSMYNYLKAYL